jgi:hypothetical protein
VTSRPTAVVFVALPLASCVACDEPSRATAATKADAATTNNDAAATCVSSSSSACWEEVEPPGRAVFPSEWEEGKWPETLLPVVAFGGNIWMTNESDSWSSVDGLSFERHDKTDWQGRLSPTYAFFQDKLWVIGGMNLDGSDFVAGTFTSVLWSSSDGVTWQNAGSAAWPPRKSTAVVVYHDAIWIFGGATSVNADGSNRTFLNDVWSSADGITWTEATPTAPWAPRADAGVEVYNGELYLVGGGGHNDVWRSSDGKAWTEVVNEAEWHVRYDQGTAVFDGKLWVFGGYVGDHRNAQNDVWFSEDGRIWTRQDDDAPWSPRSGAHNVVFRDKLWMYSGKHTGDKPVWQGDIWTLGSP